MAAEPAAPAPPPAEAARLPLVEGRPDWDALAFELTCPRCDYNLRMLETPRCPECGCATKSLGKEECEVGP